MARLQEQDSTVAEERRAEQQQARHGRSGKGHGGGAKRRPPVPGAKAVGKVCPRRGRAAGVGMRTNPSSSLAALLPHPAPQLRVPCPDTLYPLPADVLTRPASCPLPNSLPDLFSPKATHRIFRFSSSNIRRGTYWLPTSVGIAP